MGWSRIDPATFRALCQGVLYEALAKLGEASWRRRLIVETLADPKGGLRAGLAADAAAYALLVLQEHQDNLYRRLDLLRGFLRSWNCLAVLAVAGWLLRSPEAPLQAQAALLGVVGALVSGFARPASGRRIPEQLQSISLTFARLSLAALSGIAVGVLLDARLLDLGEATGRLLPAAAFAAGFSENLVARAATAVADRVA